MFSITFYTECLKVTFTVKSFLYLNSIPDLMNRPEDKSKDEKLQGNVTDEEVTELGKAMSTLSKMSSNQKVV